MGQNNNNGSKLKTILFVIIILIAVFVLILLIQATNVPAAVGVVLQALQALLFGILIACIISPMVNGVENLLRKKLSTPEKPRKEMIRLIAVLIALAVMILIIVAVIVVVIPQLGETLTSLLRNLDKLVQGFNEWVYNLIDAPVWRERIAPAVAQVVTNFAGAIKGTAGEGTEVFKAVTGGLAFAFGLVLNSFIGLVMAVYMMMSKEKLFGQIRKLSKAVFREKRGTFVAESIEEAARIFSGFFGAKILEAILMGVICFIAMVILQLPYATLISVFVGVANIIPFFGPFIGAIGGAAVIVLINPVQAIIFVVVQIILIQLDANVIGPKILGHSTGLSPFWVIVSVLLFSGCFGFTGALIGVPVFAWIYYLVKRLSEHSLKNQGLPTDTAVYIDEAEAERKSAKEKKKEDKNTKETVENENKEETVENADEEEKDKKG